MPAPANVYLILILYCWCINKVDTHLPMYVSTPSNKVEQYCILADACVHDTIPICGMMGDEKRTFMDLCDLLEYACDTSQIFTHVDDQQDCPALPKS